MPGDDFECISYSKDAPSYYFLVVQAFYDCSSGAAGQKCCIGMLQAWLAARHMQFPKCHGEVSQEHPTKAKMARMQTCTRPASYDCVCFSEQANACRLNPLLDTASPAWMWRMLDDNRCTDGSHPLNTCIFQAVPVHACPAHPLQY